MALPVNRAVDEIVLTGRVADVAATTPGYVVSPVKGKIRRAYSVVEGTNNGAAVISFAIDGATALTDTLTIANGAVAGEVDSVEFKQLKARPASFLRAATSALPQMVAGPPLLSATSSSLSSATRGPQHGTSSQSPDQRGCD